MKNFRILSDMCKNYIKYLNFTDLIQSIIINLLLYNKLKYFLKILKKIILVQRSHFELNISLNC